MKLEASEDRSRESKRPPESTPSDTNGLTSVGNIVPVTYRASEIFKGLREVVIHHNGAEYRLRITASEKLILTK